MTKLNENICDQLERAAALLRKVAGSYPRGVGRGATPTRSTTMEFIDVAASLEAIVKREKRMSRTSAGK
jgi:hypothetical protein